MEPKAFGNLVFDFYDFFQRDKKPTSDIIKKWLHQISGLSDYEIKSSFVYMENTYDNIPRNLPKAIKASAFAINQEKGNNDVQFKSYGDCEDCGGSGIFKLRISDKMGYWLEPIVYCGACDNYLNYCNDPGDRMKAAELEASGVMFKPYNKTLRYSRAKFRFRGVDGVRQIARHIGKSI